MAQLQRMIEISIDARGAKAGASEVAQSVTQVAESVGVASNELKRLDGQLLLWQEEVAAASIEMTRLDGAFGLLATETQTVGPGLQALTQGLAGVTEAAVVATKVLQTAAVAEAEVAETSEAAAASFGLLGKVVGSVKGLLAGFLGQIVALFAIKEVVTSVATFEDQMSRLKTVTKLNSDELERLGENLEGLTTKMPKSIEELTGVALIASRIGVTGVDGITKFTDAVGRLSSVTKIPANELADSMGRVLKITGESPDNADKLGTAWLKLSRMASATATDIVQLTESVSRATALYHVSSGEAAGLAAAFASVGLETRAGGTVLVQVLTEMTDAIEHGGEKMRILQAITGQTADQLKETFKTSAADAFKVFVEGLGQVQREGGNVNDVLSALGLKNDILLRVLPPLANNTQLLGRALREAQAAMVGPSGLPQQFEKFSDLAVRVLHGFEAIITRAVEFTGLGPAIKSIMIVIADALGNVDSLANGLAAVGTGVSIYGIITLAPALLTLVKAIKATTIAQTILNSVFAANPITLVALAIASLTAAFLYYKDTVVTLGDDTATVTDIIVASWSFVSETVKQMVADIGNFLKDMVNTTISLFKAMVDVVVVSYQYLGAKIMSGIEVSLGQLAGVIRLMMDYYTLTGQSTKFLEAALVAVDKQIIAISQHMREDPDYGKSWLDRIKDQLDVTFNTDWVKKMGDFWHDTGTGWFSSLMSGMFGNTGSLGKSIDEVMQGVMSRAAERFNKRNMLPAAGTAGNLDESGTLGVGAGSAIPTTRDDLTGLSDKSTDARNELKKMFDSISSEMGVLTSFSGETRDLTLELELAKQRTDTLTLAEKAWGEGTNESIDVTEKYIEMLRELDAVRRASAGRQAIFDANKGLEDQFRILTMSREEREHGTEIINMQRAAEDAYGKSTQNSIDVTSQFIDQLKELERQTGLIKLADDIGDAFGQAFEDIIFQTKSLKDAMESLVKETSQLIFHELVTKQISSYISGIAQSLMGFHGGGGGAGTVTSGTGNLGGETFAAAGKVFSSHMGHVLPFSSGGIIGAQMTFPLNGGRDVGVAGEGNRPEWAIAPLERTPDGRLGAHVKVSGNQDNKQDKRPINISMVVNAKDATSFGATVPQLSRKLASAIRSSM